MNSKTKWNRKHTERITQLEEPTENPRLKNLSTYLNGDTALDLACGLGGNSLFLARKNFHVEAIDISDVAIDFIQEKKEIENLNIYPQVVDLTDLSHHKWLRSPFDLVVITYYLDRSLFPIVKSIIKDNGYFFMETFYQAPQIENQGVSDQYKLQSKELLAEFGEWNVIFFEENELEGRQTIFCQKR